MRASWHILSLYKNFGLNETQLDDFADALDKSHAERHLWTKINDNALDVLENLKKTGFILGVISNSEDGRVKDVLEATKILPFLDIYLDSYVFGCAKPDPKIFSEATKKLDISPDQAVYIGDSYMQDVSGAECAGLSAILFDPLDLHPKKNVAKIRSLNEILN